MALPSLLISGAHIIERMWKSAMLSARSKRLSVAASAERMASLVAMTSLTIVRLMRIVVAVVAAAILDGLGNQPAAGRVAQHHEAAVRLDENGEQAVQQLRQHLFQGQGLAQVLADLQQGLELGLGVGAQPQAGRADRTGRPSTSRPSCRPAGSSSITRAVGSAPSSCRRATGSSRSGSPW